MDEFKDKIMKRNLAMMIYAIVIGLLLLVVVKFDFVGAYIGMFLIGMYLGFGVSLVIAGTILNIKEARKYE